MDRFTESPGTVIVWLVRASYAINVAYLIWAGSTNLSEIVFGSLLLIIVTFPALVILLFFLLVLLVVIDPPKFWQILTAPAPIISIVRRFCCCA